MGEKVKVSVIIPVYNAEKYLVQCLDSVLGQTLKEMEMILVDDGSTDHSLQILKQYEKKDTRIRVITQENQGPAAARNAGLAHAAGEYLAFLDADDFFAPNMLEEMYTACVEHDADISVVRSIEYHERSQVYKDMRYSIYETVLPEKNPFSWRDAPKYVFNTFKGWAWDKLFRREMVLKNKLEFQNIRSSEDMLFVFMALIYANQIYVIDKEMAYHRMNVDMSVSSTRDKTWKCFYIALMQLKKELQLAGIYKEVEQSFINWVAEFVMWQMETFIEPRTFLEAFQLMHEEGIEYFDVMSHDETYFYRKHEYEFCKFLKEKELIDCAEVLCKRLEQERDNLLEEKEWLKQEIEAGKAERAAIRNSTTYRLGEKILWLPCKILGKE